MTSPSMAADGIASTAAAPTISQHSAAPLQGRQHAMWRAVTRGRIAAQGMLASSKLGHSGNPKPGELAFFGSGHVELVTNEHHTTYGALHSGTVLGWHKWYSGSSWHPTLYLYVKHAG
jgi:hypothetical protein